MEIKEHNVDMSLSHHEPYTSQAQSDVHEQQTSSALTAACSGNTGTFHIRSTIEYFLGKLLSIFTVSFTVGKVISMMLSFVLTSLIMASLAMLITSIIIPIIIIYLVLGYWITCLHQFAKFDDCVDIDDAYDSELGSYWHDLVRWMTQLIAIIIAELMVYLALFRFGPFPLRKLSLVHLLVWKWLLICIIFLVYFGLWCLSRLSVHKARECLSSERVLERVYLFHIYEALLGVAIWGFYFLVEFLVFKLVPPLRRPKILGLYAHKWVHALVYVLIGVNVSRLLSTSIVALLHKRYMNDGKFDSKPNKDNKTSRSGKGSVCKDPSRINDFLSQGCSFIMRLLFKNFDRRKCIYVVVGLRRSVNFFFISIWLLVTWTSHFQHHLKPTKETAWVLQVVTATTTCLLICSLLWLVKNSIMLRWKYHSIYSGFRVEMIEVGIELYLLGMICGKHLDVLRVGWKEEGENKKMNDKAGKKEEETKKKCFENSTHDRMDRVVEKARIILVNDLDNIYRREGIQLMNAADEKTSTYQPGPYAIMRKVKYFLQAEDLFTKDLNESLQKVLELWHQAHGPNYDEISHSTRLEWKHIEEAYSKNKFDRIQIRNEDTFHILQSRIKKENPEKTMINLQDFERWMERSYKNCFKKVSTLACKQRLANYLDRIMITAIILTTSGIWLCMITKSTQTVALLAAPLIALSFMIGDTCSAVFKGIIFSYVIHPYDIDDLCIIENTLYEVKQIDFWRTTFLKVDTNEVVLYPNSTLFELSIINKKKEGCLDVFDRVEFILQSDIEKIKIVDLKKQIDDLRKKIDDFCKEQSTKWQKQQIEVKYENGTSINVTIHFKHNLKNYRPMSNSEWLQEMKKRKLDLQLDIMEWCADLNIKPTMEKVANS